jgi:acetyl esterase
LTVSALCCGSSRKYRSEAATSNSLAIDRELQSVKGRQQPLGRWPLAFAGTLLTVVNALHRRKFKNIIEAVAVPGLSGNAVPTLIIRPEGLTRNSPALVYYHGGAFVFKHAPQHLENAVRYAREAQCCVIFVDYRLAPKHVFPAGFADCYAALRWVVTNSERLGIDPQRIAVGGDSAGGAMAAAAAQKALHEQGIKLCGQLLIYPVTDARCRRRSTREYGDVPPFKAMSPDALWEVYLGHSPSKDLPRYASPIDGNLSGLPPAYIELAEFDPLHDQGLAYAAALRSANVEVNTNEIEGGIHGFDLLAPQAGVSKSALRRRTQFLREIFGQ